jgi:hypothetical protein
VLDEVGATTPDPWPRGITVSFSESVHQALAELPSSSLLDQGGVTDVLLDLAATTDDAAEKERVYDVMRALPTSAVLDRAAVTDLLLDLLVTEPAPV